MKRSLFLVSMVFVLMVVVSPAMAIEQGTLRVAGGATLSNSNTTLKDTGGDVDLDVTSIILSGGYFASPSVEIGITYSSTSQDIDGDELVGLDVFIPFFNYYLPVSQDFVRLGLGYITGTQTLAGEDIDVDGFQVRAGYIKMIGSAFSIDMELVYEDTEWTAFGDTIDATGTTIGASFSLYL